MIKKWHDTLIVGLIFCFISLYPLYMFENLQNQMYLIASPIIPSFHISSYKISQISKMQDVVLVAKMSYVALNDTTSIINISKEMSIFIQRYLIKGRNPHNCYEVLINDKFNKRIGDVILINGTYYTIVGKLDSDELEDLLGPIAHYNVILKFSEKIKNVSILLIWISLFSNATQVRLNIHHVLGSNVMVSPVRVSNFSLVMLMVNFFISLLATFVATILYLLGLRYDSVILFSLGWKPKYVFASLLFQFILINLIGYSLLMIFLYALISYVLRYYFFLNYILIFPLFTALVDIGVLYYSSKSLIIKKAVEVLVR